MAEGVSFVTAHRRALKPVASPAETRARRAGCKPAGQGEVGVMQVSRAGQTRRVGDGPTADSVVAALWHEYKSDATSESREQLILHYAPLLRLAADHVASSSRNVDRADLASFGLFGLIDAIEKFDPGRGFKFETYAMTRIKGAIIDELRSIDWVPRRVRADARAIGRVTSLLERELRRSPSNAEIAAELGLHEDQLERALFRIATARVLSLDETVTDDTNYRTPLQLSDTIADPAADLFERIEITESLADAVGALVERDRLVITLYYYESLTLAEIGAVLGVTESRVCQIHTQAIVKLRRLIAKADQERDVTRVAVPA